MIGMLTVEAIGWHVGSGRNPAAGYASDLYRKHNRPWCAKIIGLFSSGKFEYEFVDGKVDYSKANGAGSRGVTMTFYLDSGNVYAVKRKTSWTKSLIEYVRVLKTGDLENVSEEEAKEWAEKLDWEKTCARRHVIE